MALIRIFFSGLSNFLYLVKSNHSLKNKLKILCTFIRINFKYLFFSKLFKLKKERIFGFKIDAFDYEIIRFLYEEIFYKNEYRFISKKINPIIFDCGANIGFATIFFKWIYPESEIYAFEPDKNTFKILKKNVLQNKLKNVHLFNSAIFDKNGEIDFFIDSTCPGSLVMSTKQERMPKDKITVDCLSLSDLIKNNNLSKIDYIKMDIEGAEFEAIQDLNNNNQLKNVDKFSIEYHHKISGHKSKLSEFLRIFENNDFEYQINTRSIPINAEGIFQDMLIYIYR